MYTLQQNDGEQDNFTTQDTHNIMQQAEKLLKLLEKQHPRFVHEHLELIALLKMLAKAQVSLSAYRPMIN